MQFADCEITKGYPSTSELIMWTQVASKMRPAVTGLGPIGPYGRAAMAGDTKHKQQLGVYPNGEMFHLDGPFPMSKQKQPNIHIYIYI